MTEVEISWHGGQPTELSDLFALAESSTQELAGYIDRGRILVATDGDEAIGYLQLVESEGAREVKSMAVAERRQRQGVGRALMERAVAECRSDGVERLLVATAAADTGDLRFYQRLGFRMLRIERDAFPPARGYPEGAMIDGVPLLDRVWLDLPL